MMKPASLMTILACFFAGIVTSQNVKLHEQLPVSGKTEITFNLKWAENAFSARATSSPSGPINPGVPFSFVYGGKHSSEFLDGWTRKVNDEKVDNTKRVRTLTLTDPVTGLEVRAVVITGAELLGSKAEITEKPGSILIEYEKVGK